MNERESYLKLKLKLKTIFKKQEISYRLRAFIWQLLANFIKSVEIGKKKIATNFTGLTSVFKTSKFTFKCICEKIGLSIKNIEDVILIYHKN